MRVWADVSSPTPAGVGGRLLGVPCPPLGVAPIPRTPASLPRPRAILARHLEQSLPIPPSCVKMAEKETLTLGFCVAPSGTAFCTLPGRMFVGSGHLAFLFFPLSRVQAPLDRPVCWETFRFSDKGFGGPWWSASLCLFTASAVPCFCVFLEPEVF